MPAIGQARTYERSWLSKDVTAGLVLTGLLAPAGVAYAAAAGLPPVTGLYATILPLLVYAVFGPSRILVVGPDSALTPLIVAAVVPVVASSGADPVTVAAALAILAGGLCLAAGFARFGFLSELLSAPVRYGYLNAIALIVIVAQFAKLCGFSVKGETFTTQVQRFVEGIDAGAFNGWSFALGAASIATVVVLRAISRRIPATLIVAVGGVIASLVLDLADRGVGLVGDLPSGIPAPSWPTLDWHSWRNLLGASLGVAFVAFADTSVVSRTMALRQARPVDANHELVALGFANIASGAFGGFPVSASQSRTPVAESSGARTQLTGLVAALVVLVIAIGVPSAFRHMPEATLAAIVIAAAISLVDLPAMVRLYRVRRSEFVLAIAAWLAVAVLGPVSGVVVAVVLSVLDFLRRAWKPYSAELVRVDGIKGYHDRSRHPEGRVVPGLLLYRFDAPLFFANARHFADDIDRRIAARNLDENAAHIRCVIVTAEPITDIDTTAADTLRELFDSLAARDIELRFAELKGTVHDRLDGYAVFGDRPPPHTARTVGEAVKLYLREHSIEWVDWEDRAP